MRSEQFLIRFRIFLRVTIPNGVEFGRVEPFNESEVNVNLPPHSMTNGSVCTKVVVDGSGRHKPEHPLTTTEAA